MLHIIIEAGFAVALAGGLYLLFDMIREDFEVIMLALRGGEAMRNPAPKRETKDAEASR